LPIVPVKSWEKSPRQSRGPGRQTNRGGNYYASNSTGPIAVNGVVLAGSTCQVAGFGWYVTGQDARTGEELWRNTLILRRGELFLAAIRRRS